MKWILILFLIGCSGPTGVENPATKTHVIDPHVEFRVKAPNGNIVVFVGKDLLLYENGKKVWAVSYW